MEKRELICICCPLGCNLSATYDGKTVTVTGNGCKRGEAYAATEMTCPTRTVTSTVRLDGGTVRAAPVKTSAPIPKDSIFAALYAIKHAKIGAPVKIGDVVIKNVAGTDADVVVTRNIEKATDSK